MGSKCECAGRGIGDLLGKNGNASPFGNSVPNSLSSPFSPLSFGLGGLLMLAVVLFCHNCYGVNCHFGSKK